MFTHPPSTATLGGMSFPCHTRPIHEVRWRRFRELIGAPKRGAITDAVARLDRGQSQISQFGGVNPTKIIGDDLASTIEAAYDKPPGWLDKPLPSTVTGHTEPSPTFNAECVAEAEKWVRFEERRFGALQPVRRAERLIALYRLVTADGGSLSPEHAEAIIRNEGEVDAAQKEHPAEPGTLRRSHPAV